jgi:hypothetical protein
LSSSSADQATARIIDGRGRVAAGRLSADDPASGIEGIVARAATISIFADLPRPSSATECREKLTATMEISNILAAQYDILAIGNLSCRNPLSHSP